MTLFADLLDLVLDNPLQTLMVTALVSLPFAVFAGHLA